MQPRPAKLWGVKNPIDQGRRPGFTHTVLLTAVAMLAFAANSLLCRMALGEGLIDAASFTSARVISGAVTLSLILLPRWRMQGRAPVDWRAAAMLFTYMAFFSFAYLSLSAGTGALLLFGAVQLTMFVVALRSGEPFPALSWAGLGLAVSGLIYLVSPGVTAPDPLGAALMTVAGIAWGVYSLLGKTASDPLAATANNFIFSVPLVILVSLLFLDDLHFTRQGLALAVTSGSIASGLGYVIWYAALKGLPATRAATVQLSVPVIAAIGGVILLSEQVTLRLVLASVATLGGIALVLMQRSAKDK
ncbi:MAG: EamA family transporter [Gammaproteobacteria bacterium]|nr:EamA family transporter [Gammaproteobacteria bacterium]